MSKNKNHGLRQCGAEPFEQQQFGTAGVEGVISHDKLSLWSKHYTKCSEYLPLTLTHTLRRSRLRHWSVVFCDHPGRVSIRCYFSSSMLFLTGLW